MGGSNQDQVSAAIAIHVHRTERGPKVGADLGGPPSLKSSKDASSGQVLPLSQYHNLLHRPQSPFTSFFSTLTLLPRLTLHSGFFHTNLCPSDFRLGLPMPVFLGKDDNLPRVLVARGPQDQAVDPLPKGQCSGVT